MRIIIEIKNNQQSIESWINKKYEKIIIETPRSKMKYLVELYNCDVNYLKTVKKVICIHAANHSVSLFLKMKDQADLCLYCHPLLTFESSKQFVNSYTQKFNYPLVIITLLQEIEELFKKNGCPTKMRRWCTRVFKIEPSRLFYKRFIPSGVVEFIGIQKFQSKKRSKMDPNRMEDEKSQKKYKIYHELPIYYGSEEENLAKMKEMDITPYKESVRSFHRYGCFLCPYAGKKYYEQLKETDPDIYQKCHHLMEMGSKEGKRYYYYRKSKIM